MGLYNFNSIWSRVGYYSLGNKTVYLLQKKSHLKTHSIENIIEMQETSVVNLRNDTM